MRGNQNETDTKPPHQAPTPALHGDQGSNHCGTFYCREALKLLSRGVGGRTGPLFCKSRDYCPGDLYQKGSYHLQAKSRALNPRDREMAACQRSSFGTAMSISKSFLTRLARSGTDTSRSEYQSNYSDRRSCASKSFLIAPRLTTTRDFVR